MKYVKFYSVNDWANSSQLTKAETVLENFNKNKLSYEINELIELYNISKYIDSGLFLKSWTNSDIENYKEIVKTFPSLIGKEFNAITESNVVEIFNKVDKSYEDDFWTLVEKYRVYQKVSSDTFKNLYTQSKIMLYKLLKHKKVVENFGEVITEILLNENSAAEILLNKYEIKNEFKIPIYLPIQLNNNNVETIINNYIDSENPNPNYLMLIANVKSTSEFTVSDRTRLKAKKRAEDEQSQLFKTKTGLSLETRVYFSKKQIKAVEEELDNHSFSYSYSSQWIESNNDYNTLLNNFIYLFNYVDLQMRITLVNKPQELGVFERYIFVKSKNAYTSGIAFEQKDIISKLQMVGYNKELLNLGIRIETIIKWFFEEYLPQEFRINGFIINMPSEHSYYIEKCRAILPEMESIMKQFSLYVQDGYIDHELLQMSSGHLFYNDVPSLLHNKYVYAQSDEFTQVTYYLFSDQCMLSYVERLGDKYNSFYELLVNEDITIREYPEYHKRDIEWLVNHNYLEVINEEYLKLKDRNLINILKDLYFNEVINYWRYPEDLRNYINKMAENNIVRFESSLFSKPEQDYINYYLNKSTFNNALDLRNLYSHGTQPSGDVNNDIHWMNYTVFLRIFILFIIKLNDEFSLYNVNGKEQTETESRKD